MLISFTTLQFIVAIISKDLCDTYVKNNNKYDEKEKKTYKIVSKNIELSL